MTVVRLADRSLWVHSPIAPNEELLSDLHRLGDVRHVVAPNKSHHLFFIPFLSAFPAATGWIAPGLAEKRPDLSGFNVLHNDVPWRSELGSYFIRGLPLLNETAWFHIATGTLVLTDLLFCIGPNRSWLVRNLARALGIYGRLGMSRTMKLAIGDRAALASSLAPMVSLPLTRIIVAHDEIIETEARARFRAAFAWLADAQRDRLPSAGT
jgi:hypothetical protein